MKIFANFSDGNGPLAGDVWRAQRNSFSWDQLPQIQTGHSCCSPITLHPTSEL